MARLTIFFNSSKAKQVINLDNSFFIDGKSHNKDKKLNKSDAEAKAKSVAMSIAEHHYFNHSLEVDEFYVPIKDKS